MKKRSHLAVFVAVAATLVGSRVVAADLSAEPRVPEPPAVAMSGIWGAIAYSPEDAEHGFFWGADKKEEAEREALENCTNAGGRNCNVVTVFRNHRHWTDDDDSGFPYRHCAALSVGKIGPNKVRFWGASSASARSEAEQDAIAACGGTTQECHIREWICT